MGIFVDWSSEPEDEQVAQAVAALHPPRSPFDPDDITTWDAQQLDELGLWQAAVDGLEVTDVPPDPVAPEHAVNELGDHEFTGDT